MSADATLMFNVVDSSYIGNSMRGLARRINADLQDVFRYQMGLWGEDLTRSTQPRGVGQATYDKIRGALRKDVNKVFRIITADMEWWAEENQRTSGTPDTFVAIKDHNMVMGIEWNYFRPYAGFDEMYEHHEKYKNKSSGRVWRAENWSNEIGRWKFINKMHVTAHAFSQYLTERYRSIGRAKAGWLAMIDRYKARRPPDWISRHARAGESVVQDAFAGDGAVMTAENRVPYVSNLSRGIIAYTARIRERALHKLALLKTEKVVEMFNRLKGKGRF